MKIEAEIRVEFIILFFNIKFAMLVGWGLFHGVGRGRGEEYFSELSLGGDAKIGPSPTATLVPRAERPNDRKKHAER